MDSKRLDRFKDEGEEDSQAEFEDDEEIYVKKRPLSPARPPPNKDEISEEDGSEYVDYGDEISQDEASGEDDSEYKDSRAERALSPALPPPNPNGDDEASGEDDSEYEDSEEDSSEYVDYGDEVSGEDDSEYKDSRAERALSPALPPPNPNGDDEASGEDDSEEDGSEYEDSGLESSEDDASGEDDSEYEDSGGESSEDEEDQTLFTPGQSIHARPGSKRRTKPPNDVHFPIAVVSKCSQHHNQRIQSRSSRVKSGEIFYRQDNPKLMLRCERCQRRHEPCRWIKPLGKCSTCDDEVCVILEVATKEKAREDPYRAEVVSGLESSKFLIQRPKDFRKKVLESASYKNLAKCPTAFVQSDVCEGLIALVVEKMCISLDSFERLEVAMNLGIALLSQERYQLQFFEQILWNVPTSDTKVYKQILRRIPLSLWHTHHRPLGWMLEPLFMQGTDKAWNFFSWCQDTLFGIDFLKLEESCFDDWDTMCEKDFVARYGDPCRVEYQTVYTSIRVRCHRSLDEKKKLWADFCKRGKKNQEKEKEKRGRRREKGKENEEEESAKEESDSESEESFSESTPPPLSSIHSHISSPTSPSLSPTPSSPPSLSPTPSSPSSFEGENLENSPNIERVRGGERKRKQREGTLTPPTPPKRKYPPKRKVPSHDCHSRTLSGASYSPPSHSLSSISQISRPPTFYSPVFPFDGYRTPRSRAPSPLAYDSP